MVERCWVPECRREVVGFVRTRVGKKVPVCHNHQDMTRKFYGGTK